MICPHCLAEIPDDSSYCDQCSKKIMICPTCGSVGKSGYCFNDGAHLVHNSKEAQFSKNKFFKTVRIDANATTTTNNQVKLVNKNLNLELVVDKETLIGRECGNFKDVFSSFNQVSSKHLILKSSNSNKQWLVVDLNSSNGTKVNNQKLIPGKEYIITNGDFLVIANVEFYVDENI
jgi:hypothetical protein